MLVVRNLPRKKMLFAYAFIIALCNCLIALFDIWNVNAVVCIVVVAMVFTQDCLGVPVAGLYCIEITNNSSLGVI